MNYRVIRGENGWVVRQDYDGGRFAGESKFWICTDTNQIGATVLREFKAEQAAQKQGTK